MSLQKNLVAVHLELALPVPDLENGGFFTSYFWSPNIEKAEGRFFVYIPSDILSLVNHSTGPQPGDPRYIAYSIDYTDEGTTGTEESRVIETDIIGFRWTPMFSL